MLLSSEPTQQEMEQAGSISAVRSLVEIDSVSAVHVF